jgi:hypothetical protein
MNVIYPDGTGKLHVGTRSLQIPLRVVVDLIKMGVEFFYFEGDPFCIEHGVDITESISKQLGLGKPKKQRIVTAKDRAPTRVSRVLITDPDGREFEVNNLLGWMKQTFPERYKSLYFAAVRGQSCQGYKVKHLGWVTMTVVGSEEFIKNNKETYGKRNRRT